ncbi:cupin domain-containing protein [Hymenobacter canadensis]|uniref:Cupin domain-containing protein n=1 Tax=Hymenobacter canadensis TaxID=2999067 RepID=A0ABY7LX59_9BACT|nr:cupin domain-containing protein [Hymenobacter canadensis]WBA44017.1 cupin domain-containing protein [Hymenobacter canadensis]
MLNLADFTQQNLAIDQDPATMFVQHERTENSFPLHQHQKSQLLYVLEGLAFVETPGHTYYLPARHYVWIPPGLEHRLLARSAQYRLHSLCFAEAADAAHPFYGVLGIYPVATLLYELLCYTERWQGLVAPSEADVSASPNRVPVVSRERRNFHYLTTAK